MRRILFFSICLLSASQVWAQGPSTSIEARGRLDAALRESTQFEMAQTRRGPRITESGGFSGEKLDRVKHGAFSLLIPGWSQYRSGHNKRAMFFAGAEMTVWGAWIFSKLQADYRQDRYIEYAQQFAQVQSNDHDDEDGPPTEPSEKGEIEDRSRPGRQSGMPIPHVRSAGSWGLPW